MSRFVDSFDIADEDDELDGFHVVGEETPNEPVVCSWGCGDSEGLCVLERWGCYQLGCELVSD